MEIYDGITITNNDNNENAMRVEEETDRKAKEHIDRILRAARTLNEMLRDRGYAVDEFDEQKFREEHERKLMDPTSFIYLWSALNDGHGMLVVLGTGVVNKGMIDLIKEEVLKVAGKDFGSTDVIVASDRLKGTQEKQLEREGWEHFQLDELQFNITKHVLEPEFHVLTKAEKDELFQEYSVTKAQLPRMLRVDPIARYYGLKDDDIIRITRKSMTAGKYVFYRRIVN